MATDLDDTVNAKITYPFISTGKAVRQLFKLDSKRGALTTGRRLDFEETESYTIGVEEKDGESHTEHCKMKIDILDENNAPNITANSESQHIQDVELGAAIALFKTRNLDSPIKG
jgi:hypothetical protein